MCVGGEGGEIMAENIGAITIVLNVKRYTKKKITQNGGLANFKYKGGCCLAIEGIFLF